MVVVLVECDIQKMSGGYARPIYVTPTFRIRQRRVRASRYSNGGKTVVLV